MGSQEPVYRFSFLTGVMPFSPPRYRVTRTTKYVGIWPFRRTEITYTAASEFSTLTMGPEAFDHFVAQCGKQIVEVVDA